MRRAASGAFRLLAEVASGAEPGEPTPARMCAGVTVPPVAGWVRERRALLLAGTGAVRRWDAVVSSDC
jgi:hypothetical protein